MKKTELINKIKGIENKLNYSVDMAALSEIKKDAALRIIESCMANMCQAEIDRIELLHSKEFEQLNEI